MKLRKGTKVEILGNTEKFAVEWRCAQIISGNGHTYEVQYDCSRMTSEACAERVPRKAIRPCPPLIEGIEHWEVKNVVEVYDDGSWKAASVLKHLGGGFYLVRLLVSCKELKVHHVHTRVRQSWENGQWIVKPVGPGNHGVGKFSRNLISNNYKGMPEVQKAKKWDLSGLNETFLASPSTLKRASPHCSPSIEDYPRKKRVFVNLGMCESLTAMSRNQLLEKVDAIAYPQNNMGEKCTHSSFPNSAKQYYEIRKGNPCNARSHFPQTIEEPDYFCSSSVGSCSVISSANNSFDDTLAGPCPDDDTLSSDAESLDVGDMDMDEGCTIPPKEVVAERIHRASIGGLLALLPMAKFDGFLVLPEHELAWKLRP